MMKNEISDCLDLAKVCVRGIEKGMNTNLRDERK